MPVYITDADALERITQVECRIFGEDKRRSFAALHSYDDQIAIVGTNPFTFGSFKHAFLSLRPKEKQCADLHESVRVDDNCAIYGIDGWHRYFVRKNTGEILFSKSHSMEMHG